LITRNYAFFEVIFIPVGLTAIVFSHDLTMRDKTRYKQFTQLAYKIHRGAFIFTGIVFIVLSIVKLAGY
jgi:hypothetical protein